MKKVLFVIHDLGQGGAEKVLVNLVNNMDRTKFDVTVLALFAGGVNEQFLSPQVHYKTSFQKMIPGNSHLMKLLTPRQLHNWLIKDQYDVEIAYLEGPSARIVSGCPDKRTKKTAWIHIEQKTKKRASQSFRSYREAMQVYGAFDRIICVSKTVQKDFFSLLPAGSPTEVLYNTNESAQIAKLAKEEVPNGLFVQEEIKLVGVGKLTPTKGFDRLAKIHRRLRDDGYPVHTYILGIGPEETRLRELIKNLEIEESFTLLGYDINPYKYVAHCDLFICASYAEGFSTAATEALIVGTPVCTTEVSGMKEMLGEHNEYGLITKNDEDALYHGIRSLLDNPKLLAYYTKQAALRGKDFSTAETVAGVQNMLLDLCGETNGTN